MTGTELETLIRNQTGISESKIDTPTLFSYVNIVRNDMRSKIEKWVSPNFRYAPFVWNLVANTNTYNIDDDLTWIGKLFKVKDLEVKYSNNDEYPIKLQHWRIEDYYQSREQLKAELNESEAFWSYENNNIVLFPAPTEDVVWGLIAYWPYVFPDIDDTAWEWDIFPWHDELIGYENILALWVIPYLERHRNIKDKADIQNSEVTYREKLAELIDELNTKYNSVVYWALPSTKHLQV